MSIRLTDLVKRFGNALVVNKVSLEVQAAELFVLLGGSGSGKSTILRMIAGLLEPDSGQIYLNGRDVTALSPQARHTGFVFQNYSLFRHMNALQNIEFGLRIRGVPPAERRQRSEELLDLVGLAGLGERYTDQLSGGQQQRIALARALAYKPDVLLLDEPFGALDVKIRAQLRETLKTIQRQLKLTTILVTHDQEEAFELADHIGLLSQGSLVEVDTPEVLYHHPRTEFAATFVGGGNVLVGRAGKDSLRFGSVSLPLHDQTPQHEPGAPIRILFRPESVVLQTEPFASTGGVYVLGQGQVTGRTFAGAFQRIQLAFNSLANDESGPVDESQPVTHLVATVPGDPLTSRRLADQTMLWVGLRDYHVLTPTGLKILICADGSAPSTASAAFGCRLAQAAHGPTTLLGVVSTAKALSDMRNTLDTLRQQLPEGDNPQLQVRVRQGHITREILLEAQEGHYELIVVGRGNTLGATARQLLEQTKVPLLLVNTPRPGIQRILICTAAGEPGKADVLFSQRIARRTGAHVTILYVRKPESPLEERKRVDRHLNLLHAALEASEVSNEVIIREGRVRTTILQEAEAGDYDLVVLGASMPRTRRLRPWAGRYTHQLVRRIKQPVLVVPMS